MRKTALLACAAFLGFPATAEAEGWLCIADQATGFAYNTVSRKWEVKRFSVEDGRYIIRRSTEPGFTWEIRKFGSDENQFPIGNCKSEFSDEVRAMTCEFFGHSFRFNNRNLRFLLTYDLGYWTYNADLPLFSKEDGDTPIMEIGTCSAI